MSAIPITVRNFHREVMLAREPVLLCFQAPWCRSDWTGEILSAPEVPWKVCVIDADRYPELANRFLVSRLPTLLLLREGKEAGRFTEPVTLETLRRL